MSGNKERGISKIKDVEEQALSNIKVVCLSGFQISVINMEMGKNRIGLSHTVGCPPNEPPKGATYRLWLWLRRRRIGERERKRERERDIDR